MKTRILSLVLCVLMLVSMIPVSVSAADEIITLDAFIAALNTAANGGDSVVYDGAGVTVKFTNKVGEADYHAPDSTNQAAGTVAQYYGLFGDFPGWQAHAVANVEISNVNFVFVPDSAAAITTAEFQLYCPGNITFTGCSFDKVALCPWGYGNDECGVVTITDCAFKNIANRHAMQQVRAEEFIVSGCTFENCSGGGIHINSSNPESIEIINNTFSDMAKRCVYFGEKGNYDNIPVCIAGNTCADDVIPVEIYKDNQTTVFEILAYANAFAAETLVTSHCSAEIKVKDIFEMEDFGLWGESWFGAYNVGWRYTRGFDTDTITAIEVGMKDPDGKLIVKYTASGDQLAYQRENGYIGTQSSAPFYKEYQGTPIPEGADLDWTVVKGEGFTAWNVATCYVTVTAGEYSCTLTNTCSHTHNFVDEKCAACGADLSCQHTEGAWLKKDDKHHWFECMGCNDVLGEKAPHTPATEYEYDETYHWHFCTEQGCAYKVGMTEHTYEEGVCTECGAEDANYVPPKQEPTFDYVLFALVARFSQKFDVLVSAENATVTGDMSIKYKRNGTVNIDVAEGYKIVDVIANGQSLGAVETVTFKKVTAPQTLVILTDLLGAE